VEKDITSKWKKEKAGVAILLLDEIGFKTDCNKRQRKALHNNKGVNPARRYNIYKYICSQHRSTKINKANINRHKGGHQKQYSNNSGLQHLTSISG